MKPNNAKDPAAIERAISTDRIYRDAYGADWIRSRHAMLFQHPAGGDQQPAEVLGWQWSETFGRWSALVTFRDGRHCWTWPSRTERGRHAQVAKCCHVYNRATNPAELRSDAEHAEWRAIARGARETLRAIDPNGAVHFEADSGRMVVGQRPVAAE